MGKGYELSESWITLDFTDGADFGVFWTSNGFGNMFMTAPTSSGKLGNTRENSTD